MIVCLNLTRLTGASTWMSTFPCLQYKHESHTYTLTQLYYNQTATLCANYPLCCIIYHRAAGDTSDWVCVCICKCTVCSTFRCENQMLEPSTCIYCIYIYIYIVLQTFLYMYLFIYFIGIDHSKDRSHIELMQIGNYTLKLIFVNNNILVVFN